MTTNDYTTMTSIVPAFQAMGGSLDAKQRKKRIRFWTMLCISFYVVLSLVSTIGSMFAFLAPEIFAEEAQKAAQTTMEETGVVVCPEEIKEDMLGFFAVIFGATFVSFLIVYLCCYYFYLHRLWEEIPNEFARTTPGNAAGLALIPFYNFYWQFIAFGGLYRNMNEATASCGLKPRFELSLVQFACVFWIVMFVIVGLIGNIIPIVSEDMLKNESFMGCILVLSFVEAIFTVWVYWFVSSHVLEFIDFKSSMNNKTSEPQA